MKRKFSNPKLTVEDFFSEQGESSVLISSYFCHFTDEELVRLVVLLQEDEASKTRKAVVSGV